MSEQKHVHVLDQLSAHPIARTIEWSDLLPALSSIGLLQAEKNGSYHFTRNGHTLVFEVSRRKEVDVEEVLKLRHFLRTSATPESSELDVSEDVIVAIDHHQATMYYGPGTASERRVRVHADLTSDRILHTHPTHAPFHEASPSLGSEYYEQVVKDITKSRHIVLLSHGAGTSSAASRLLAILHKRHPGIASRIVAVKACDLEAMTEPQLVQLGIQMLQAPGD